VGLLGVAALAGVADAADPPPAYSATAAASGVNVRLTAPGFPLTATPVDGGGPTAQAQLSSVGTAEGYAAFPDPGSLVVSVPRLVTGLLSQGVAGVPPIPLPTLPGYPFAITSDTLAPDVSAGTGPYVLHATSSSTATTARASGGLDLGAGAVTAVVANAKVVEDDGTVVATASTEVSGLALGPLALGRVVSTATLTQAPDGQISSTGTVEVHGAKVGALSVSIDRSGLNVLGVPVAAPIQETLEQILGAAGIRVEYQGIQKTETTVVAPAMVLTMPVDLTDLGGVATEPGTLSVTLGQAIASLTPAGFDPGAGDASIDDGSASLADGASSSVVDAGVPDFGAPAVTPSVAARGRAPDGAPATATEFTDRISAEWPVGQLYLVVVLLAIAAFVTATGVRILGVKIPWESRTG
jgi:hypothetical protein